MHKNNRSGVITGTREQLARISRCSTVEFAQAMAELQNTKTADVTERCANVTLVNRLMKREAKDREGSRLRMEKMRGDGNVTGQKIEVRCKKSDNTKESASPPMSKFRKPEFAELELYAAKIGLPVLEINRFVDYYESNGWKVGKNPMKDWQAAMRNWQRNFRTYGNKNNVRTGAQGVDRNAGTYNASTSSDGLKSKVR